jgi:uncharacterized protein (DUF58 family)
MGYRSDGVPLTKLQYASYLAASLAYLMTFQHDAAGLITFDTKERDQVPPRQGPGHLRVLMQALEQTKPGGETSLADTFHRLAESIKRRSLVVILSDLFDDADRLVGALKHFRHKKHEVIVLQILDPAEVEFPFDDITRIEDMESAREVTSDPQAFRNAYLREFAKFMEEVRAGCRTAGIDHVAARTDQRFDLFLGNYLARRQALTV